MPTEIIEGTTITNGMYNELLYNLDLCILAYHLYHQTLIWPMDPFYEQQVRKGTDRRMNFMNVVRRGPGTLGAPPPTTYKGPGNFLTQQLPENIWLDPIITDYTRLNPWKPSFFKATDAWEIIQPSKYITDRINSIYMCQSPKFEPTEIRTIVGPEDKLYCFEGGTGGRELPGRSDPHAWSMMGFILVRNWGSAGEYDVHIAFRGSRSGSAGRAAADALVGLGNPDWVTDLDWNYNPKPDQWFSPRGFSRIGFTQSMKSILPALRACLGAINTDKKEVPPKTIYVTGHSLGGALAIMCASALAIGTPGGGPFKWPWKDLRLITFSAPTVGDMDFCITVNSQVYARRVYLSGDPITTAKIKSWGAHIGSRIELPKLPEQWNIPVKASTFAHDYSSVRRQLISILPTMGTLFNVEKNPSIIQRYPNFLALYNDHLDKLKKECLPDYQTHLKEYLNVFKCIIPMDSSYKIGVFDGSVVNGRVKQIENLIKDLSSEQSVQIDNIADIWNKACWSWGASDVNNFLGLCLALSLLAKDQLSVDRLPQPIKDLLMNI